MLFDHWDLTSLLTTVFGNSWPRLITIEELLTGTFDRDGFSTSICIRIHRGTKAPECNSREKRGRMDRNPDNTTSGHCSSESEYVLCPDLTQTSIGLFEQDLGDPLEIQQLIAKRLYQEVV